MTKQSTAHVMDMIDELRNNSSTNEKQDIILRYTGGVEEENGNQLFAKTVLNMTYCPYSMYNVTSKQVKKHPDLCFGDCEPGYGLPSLFQDLRSGRYTGHDAIRIINTYINKFPYDEELVYLILDKDLKTRTGAKLINKAVPGLIKQFNVALADKFNPDKHEWGDGWYVSRKLDGVRCVAVIDAFGDITFYTRTGKEITTLGVVYDGIKCLELTNKVLDGELCLIDDDGNEDFQGIMKQIRKKDHTIKNPSFKIFDMIDFNDFQNGTSKSNLEMRLVELALAMEKNECPCLSVLRMSIVKDDEGLEFWAKKADEYGWEGVMLRKNTTYKGKRSKDLLKVKTFHDAEYTVDGVEMGPFRYVKDGAECEEEMLSCVYITHRGHRVRVGSGFSIEQRQDFYRNPELIQDMVILVQYFEETTNQDGGISLRFPTFKFLHGDSREV